ncbi:MAG: ketopantoate reductase family protein, partial [Promethearchaeota archaeon]
NVGINPLGALTRLRNGDLLNDVKLKDLISSLVEEAVVVANAVGLNLDKNECLELTFSVADKTRENLNSMLQDILRGRQTEIEFMNGKIVSLAEELGISVPMNDIIVRLIRGLERSMLKAGGMN